MTLLDHRQENLDDAGDRIREVVPFLRSEGLTDRSPDGVAAGIDDTLDGERELASAAIVVESVPEELALKRDVLGELVDAPPEEAVLASNTSGILITEVAQAVPDSADRVVGCHWW